MLKQELDLKYLKHWLEQKYPCTILRDRYSGTYSGGLFVAFPFSPNDIPAEADGSDIECALLYGREDIIFGKGETPDQAYWNMVEKIRERYVKLSKAEEDECNGTKLLTIRKRPDFVGYNFNPDHSYTIAMNVYRDGAEMAVEIYQEPLGDAVWCAGDTLNRPLICSEPVLERLKRTFGSVFIGCRLATEDGGEYVFKYEKAFCKNEFNG